MKKPGKKVNINTPDDLEDPVISGPPIPEDLFFLYKQAMAGEVAICTWNDVGAKNSRWLSIPANVGQSLLNLLERIARLENALGDILEALERDKEFRKQPRVSKDMALAASILNDSLVKLLVAALAEARTYRQNYKLQ
jgi:hypothetical protein